MSHQDASQVPPPPPDGGFLATLAVRAAYRIPLLWVLLAGPAMPSISPQASPVPLQALIDQAKPGDLLTPEPGIYAGPLTIDKPLTLDGRDQVIIDGKGTGTVILLKTDGATIRNLHLTNSGNSHNDIDSGIQVRGNFNVIKDNLIENCLFGIDLQQSNNNIIRRNRISSKPVDLGIRGDAIRFWYSYRNQATDNIIRNSRDTVVWYSQDNLIARNDARGGRYSLHFMYSRVNRVEDNHYENNSVGIFVMYSDGMILRNNTIINASGPTGIGMGFKDTSDVEVSGNQVLSCATGIYLDLSPYQPGTTNRFTHNLIAFNGVAVRWLPGRDGNIFIGNRFEANITQVVLDGGAGKDATFNVWEGNYWDDYEGFDRDGNGIGDTPYEQYTYADRLWMDLPPAQFFKGSPMLEVIDFLERLAPFSAPRRLARDEKPLRSLDTPVDIPAILARYSPRSLENDDEEEDPENTEEGVRTTSLATGPTQSSDPPTGGGFDAYQALRQSLSRD